MRGPFEACTYNTVLCDVDLGLVIVDELSSAGVDGSHEEENDVEQNDGLNLPDGDACLEVKLGKGPLPGHDLTDDGSDKAELGHATDKQLVGLGEAEDRA